MTRRIAGSVLVVVLALCGMTLNVFGVTVTETSTDFSFGFGINDIPPQVPSAPNWNVMETAAANTDVTGPFAFTPTVVGDYTGSAGPIFGPPPDGTGTSPVATPRVLADGGQDAYAGGPRQGLNDFCAQASSAPSILKIRIAS